MNGVKAPVAKSIQIFPVQLFIARLVRTVHQRVTAVFVDMCLDMTPRHDLVTTVVYKGAFDLHFIAHVDEQTGHVEKDLPGGDPTAGAFEEIHAGGWVDNGTGDGGGQAILTKDVVTVESNGLDKGTVTNRTHKMVIVHGCVLQAAEVNQIAAVAVAIRLHDDELVEIHG